MFLLYLMVILDKLSNGFIFLMVLGWVCVLGYIVVRAVRASSDGMDSEEDSAAWKKMCKFGLPIMTVWTLITCMIPSTKQVAFIYVVGKMSQNKIIQGIGEKSLQIPDKALDILTIKMNQYLDELKDTAVEEKKQRLEDRK